MNTRQEIEAEIARLQKQLSSLPIYDWDNMTNEAIGELFASSDSQWPSWSCCPVGTLTQGREDHDRILRMLGYICVHVTDKNWQALVRGIRQITRLRLKELDLDHPLA